MLISTMVPLLALLASVTIPAATAFSGVHRPAAPAVTPRRGGALVMMKREEAGVARDTVIKGQAMMMMAIPLLGALGVVAVPPASVAEEEPSPLPPLEGNLGGKPRMRYPDFTLSPTGLQYKLVKEGAGDGPAPGDRVVIDWEGWTIGYYGKPFEGRGKIKGGAFDSDKDFLRFILGKQPMIPAIEEAVQRMKPGGVAQLIVPPELGYPSSDPSHDRVGPKPSSFSGQRALDFVLQNQGGRIDKTLLINLKLIRVDKPGQRGFKG